jgi:hypothetical protein
MTDNKYTVSDLVISAVEQKPIEFENIFKEILTDRIHSAVEDRKISLAQDMYAKPFDLDVEE